MVASDDRLPHQIFTKGKMNNAVKTLSSTHLQLRTKRFLQKTSSSNYWNINIQQPSNETCFAATIETWPAKYETRLEMKQKTASKFKPYLP